MFEVGYSEILVIAIVLIVIVGPKDLPKMLRAFGKAMTRFRQVSGDFRRQFDDALKEAELDEVRKTIDDVRKLDPRQQVRDVFNPLRSAADSIRNDIQGAVKPAMQSNPNGTAMPAAAAQVPVATVKTVDPKITKSPSAATKVKAAAATKGSAKSPPPVVTKPVVRKSTQSAKPAASTVTPAKKPVRPATTKPVAAKVKVAETKPARKTKA